MMNDGFPGKLVGKTTSLEVFEQIVQAGNADSVFLDVDITVLAVVLPKLEDIRVLHPRLLIIMMVPTSLDHITLHIKGRVVNVLLRRLDEGEELIRQIQNIFRLANASSATEPLDIPFTVYWNEYSRQDTGPDLTPFELVVLTKLCEQKSSSQIARELTTSVQVIEDKRLALQRKLGVSNVAGLIFIALQKGIFID